MSGEHLRTFRSSSFILGGMWLGMILFGNLVQTICKGDQQMTKAMASSERVIEHQLYFAADNIFKFCWLFSFVKKHDMGLNMRKSSVVCAQKRRRPACTWAQSDQDLCY